MQNKEKGYTLIELLIVIIFIGFLASILIGGITMLRGNCYWSEETALELLKEEHPSVSKILISKSERNIWQYSKIVVLENGKQKTYCLDTNILFDYKILECQ